AVRASAVPNGWILHYDGTSWSTVLADSVGLYGLRGSSDGSVHAVGGGGRVYRGVRGATVDVTPASDTLTVLSQTTTLSATAFDGGIVVSGATFTWSSSNPGVGTVDATGVVTAVGNGTATITATARGGAAGDATIVVSVP
ncbi:MAG: Ig domain-containing protein, partial [Gemmatimonadales bacterium]